MTHLGFGMRARVGILTALVVLGCGKQERSDPTAAALADFEKRVNDYAALHQRLADTMGPLDETKSQAEIAARATTLAHLIATERANAKLGNIFTPEVATLLTTIIREENSRRPESVKAAREEQEEEHRSDGLQDFAPSVNQVYPTSYPLASFPPTLLPLLPKLPPEIEYRIVTHYLILRDVEANLIIDFIPNAVP
jgi:hypothetical protein